MISELFCFAAAAFKLSTKWIEGNVMEEGQQAFWLLSLSLSLSHPDVSLVSQSHCSLLRMLYEMPSLHFNECWQLFVNVSNEVPPASLRGRGRIISNYNVFPFCCCGEYLLIQ